MAQTSLEGKIGITFYYQFYHFWTIIRNPFTWLGFDATIIV